VLVGALTFVVVAGLVAGGVTAFRFVRGASDRLASLTPDDTAAYFTAYLDPPASQKLAANGLLSKLPAVSTSSALDAAIDRLLDTALADSGLNHSDVHPWLGSQVAGAVSSKAPAGAVHSVASAAMINSTDNTKAKAALQKFEHGAAGSKYSWASQDDDGVSVRVGHDHGGGTFAWAIVNDEVVVSNSADYTDEIIHTAHGSHASLTGTSDYSTALSQVPADKLALVYLDVPKFANFAGSAGARPAALPLGDLAPGVANLAAYHGAAFALSAQSDGVVVDGTIDYDLSKMTPAQRTALQVSPDVNKALGFVPERAYGVYALTGLPQTVRSLLDSLGSSNSGRGFGSVAELFLKHLTGDAALEVDRVSGQSTPSVAVLLAMDSDLSAQQLLSNLVHGLCGFGGSCDASSTQTHTYRGTTISTLQLSNDAARYGVAPSWAAKDGMAILASSLAEVEAVLDARASGNVTSAPAFVTGLRHNELDNNSVAYLDINAIDSAVRSALPPAERSRFDSQVAPYLDHFTSLLETTKNSSDRSTLHAFIEVR